MKADLILKDKIISIKDMYITKGKQYHTKINTGNVIESVPGNRDSDKCSFSVSTKEIRSLDDAIYSLRFADGKTKKLTLYKIDSKKEPRKLLVFGYLC